MGSTAMGGGRPAPAPPGPLPPLAAAAAERGMVGARTSFLMVSLGVIVIAALWQSDNLIKEPEIAIEDGRSQA